MSRRSEPNNTDTLQASASGASSSDKDAWTEIEFDGETEEWNIDDDERGEATKLLVKFTCSLNYDNSSIPVKGAKIDIGFDSHRLFGGSSTDSIADLFPNLTALNV